MTHLDLFSGIGGFALAASWVWGAAHHILAFCENNPFCRQVLKKHWPDVPICEDIHHMKGDYHGTIDLVTGGFPCQPFSQAGKQQGTQDDRYLWPEMARMLREQRHIGWPVRNILLENVPGIVNLALDDVLSDLERAGYEVQTLSVPACAVNAPHRRQRIWIVGHIQSSRLERGYYGENSVWSDTTTGSSFQSARNGPMCQCKTMAHAQSAGLAQRGDRSGKGYCQNSETPKPGGDRSPGCRLSTTKIDPDADQQRFVESGLGRVVDGLSAGVDGSFRQWDAEPAIPRVVTGGKHRCDRLRALGNAIVPQVAAVLMRFMKQLGEDV